MDASKFDRLVKSAKNLVRGKIAIYSARSGYAQVETPLIRVVIHQSPEKSSSILTADSPHAASLDDFETQLSKENPEGKIPGRFKEIWRGDASEILKVLSQLANRNLASFDHEIPKIESVTRKNLRKIYEAIH